MTQSETVSGLAETKGYLDARRVQVDELLAECLPAATACPPLVLEAMRYSLFAGGKRLRPILTLAAAEALSTDPTLAHPAACAIEMIHTYSLIHDDLPAMDNDTLRRGRPTAHVVYGDGIAILAGDGLLTEAFGILSRRPETRDPTIAERKRRTLERIAAAAGPAGMVGGQAIDLLAAGQVPHRSGPVVDLDGLQEMHQRKTGALIRAAAVAGAIMAGASEEAIRAVDNYASRLGLGFQIVDDVLDVEGTTDTMGKTSGKDAASGKPTYPSIVGVARSRELAAQAIAEAKASLRNAGLGGHLEGIAEWVLSRTS